MKKITLVLVALLMVGGMVMAQDGPRGGNKKMPDPKARAERMTERMAKELNLTDAQKQQLLELNLEQVEKMKDTPRPPRRPNMKRGKSCGDSCCCGKAERPNRPKKMEGKRPEPTEEQRTQMKADREKRKAEMKSNREAYDKKLQQILTPEQYTSYQKKQDERKNAKKEKRD